MDTEARCAPGVNQVHFQQEHFGYSEHRCVD